MYNKKIYKSYFTVPAVVVYTLLFMVPVVLNFYFSLTDWNALKISGETARFIGFKNFKKIFQNPELLSVIGRTVLFAAVTTIFKNVIGFALALAFNEGMKTKNVLRAVFFLPAMLSPLIIGLIFGSIFMKAGFANQLLSAIGLDNLSRAWLTTKETALGTTMFVEIWRQVGFNMVIYLAGLQLIDKSYYEAATIDGASKWQQIKNITIPLLVPLMIVLTIMAIGGIFRSDFGLFYQVPRNSAILYPVTDVIDTYIYKGLMNMGNIGMSTAAGLYQSVVGFVLIMITNYIVKKIDPEYGLF